MMTVYVNNQRIELFNGATLKHALLKANELLYHDVRKRRAVIKDSEGNLTDLNGAVMNGWHYIVVYE
ncbi:hypothetical protein [Amphibacillus cookii]|uniref:hypothetical protein n=1 Tax=Amphibacillus cookii TaxID=767787 RepID=UPI00195B6BEB|nr:hypothetical protein [Amphibacillus cookii]MBM7539843.1 hypothetical protein [Amphibacillus cookii]